MKAFEFKHIYTHKITPAPRKRANRNFKKERKKKKNTSTHEGGNTNTRKKGDLDARKKMDGGAIISTPISLVRGNEHMSVKESFFTLRKYLGDFLF